jgi:DNA processing protein
MFGLKDSDAVDLAQALSGRDLDDAWARKVIARAIWTGLVEPGDSAAGLVVSALGAGSALALVAGHRSAADVLAALAEVGAVPEGPRQEEVLARDLEKALARWKPRLMPSSALVALRRAEGVGARLLVPSTPVLSDTPIAHASWPSGLDDLGFHAPIALWFRGTETALSGLRNSIALVGARAATGYGEHVTMEASAGLVDRGYAIVSGAAYGIDGMAHRAALASNGTTVAFLAGGVDRFYPSGHEDLLTRIAESGAVISELPCGEPPTKWRFLQRNRLIAAASGATVVLEAGWRSGSLNTAGHAASLGRPLGAVPGPVTSAASAGCHRLIREFEAVCVTNPDEMAELAPIEIEPAVGHGGGGSPQRDLGALQLTGLEDSSTRATGSTAGGAQVTLGDRPSLQLRVLDALSTRTPRSSADVAARSGLAVSTVQGVLGVLQLERKVVEHAQGWVVT